MVTLGALPAWANNPPQPDGLFSIILIFPVVILGFRLAGASYTEGERKWRWLRGVLFGLAVILAMAGSEIAIVPLLFLLTFGLTRGIQIMNRGQGSKRIWVGALVCLWTLFAVSDYIVSLEAHSLILANESSAVSRLRLLSNAEVEFSEKASKASTPAFGTLEDLAKTGMIDQEVTPVYAGYRFTLTLSDDKSKYVISALPLFFGKAARNVAIIPGESWLRLFGFNLPKATGSRNFAVTESGEILSSEDHLVQTPGRQEVEKWKTLY
jgi:hypothetical protein